MVRCRALRLIALSAAALLACAAPERPAPPAAASSAPPAPSAPSRELYRTDAVRHRVEVDAHPLTVWSKASSAAARPTLLVHGRTWSGLPDFDLQVPGESRSLMDALLSRGFAPYAVDLRGYGGTPRDATGWLTPLRAADDVAAVVRWVAARHEGRAPVLLGWSLGAMIAQLVAQREPASIEALVLYGYPHDPDHTFTGEDPPGPPPRQPTSRAAAASDFIVAGATSAQTIETYVRACLASDPARMDWRGAGEWNQLAPEAVRVPTLLVHGEHDPLAPGEVQQRVLDRLGHARRARVALSGGDHAAHLEDTRPAFVEAVASFLAAPP